MSNLMNDTTVNISHDQYDFSEFNFEEHNLDLEKTLDHQSHTLIVFTGAIIGGILSLFITYQLNTVFIFFILLSILPIGIAYILRKVYINTMVKIDH